MGGEEVTSQDEYEDEEARRNTPPQIDREMESDESASQDEDEDGGVERNSPLESSPEEEGGIIINGVSYVPKQPTINMNEPDEVTLNGVKYVAKNKRSNGHGDNAEFQKFANGMENPLGLDDDEPTQYPTGMPEFGMIPSVPPNMEPEENIMKKNIGNNNIADVVKAILPEVVKTIREESQENREKRNNIPTHLPPTTTRIHTTHTKPTTHPPTHAQKKSVTSSAVDQILNGLKALGIGNVNKKDIKPDSSKQMEPHLHKTPARTTIMTTTTTTTHHVKTTPMPPPPKHLTPPIPHIVNIHDPQQIRILCFGDSLTAGYNKHGKSFYPYCSPLGNVLRYHSRYNILTEAKGIVGEMAHKQMTHRLPLVLGNATFQYDWIIILGGTNDILHVKNFGDDDEFLNQLEDIWQPRITKDIEKLHQIAYTYGAHTVLLTIPENSIEAWPGYHPLLKMREKINDSLRDFAYDSKGRTVLCDLAKLVPRRSLGPAMENIIWDDHLHMTPQGYTKMANAVSDCLRAYLPGTTK